MNTHHIPLGNLRRGFTLVEALVTIAILGIMATLVVTAFSNAATDSARMIARQQQTAVQGALNAWIGGDSNRVTVINATTGAAKMMTIEEIRTRYNNASTSSARLALVSGYLDDTTFQHLYESTVNGNQIQSEALIATDQFLSFPTWNAGAFPQVQLQAK